MKNIEQPISRFIDEGNPNTEQKIKEARVKTRALKSQRRKKNAS